jgi:hypothetical protein
MLMSAPFFQGLRESGYLSVSSHHTSYSTPLAKRSVAYPFQYEIFRDHDNFLLNVRFTVFLHSPGIELEAVRKAVTFIIGQGQDAVN